VGEVKASVSAIADALSAASFIGGAAAFAARWSGASDRGAQFGGEEARARDRPARTKRLQAAFALAVPRHQDRVVHRWPVDAAAGKLDDMAHAGALGGVEGVGLEPVQVLAIHDDERLIHAGECRFQTCGIVEVADDEFDLGAELRRLRAVAHQTADAVSGFDQVPDHFGSHRAGGASHKDER